MGPSKLTGAVAVASFLLSLARAEQECIGLYLQCPSTNACMLLPDDCSKCMAGQYLCPDRKTCTTLQGLGSCPNTKGTFWDHTLPHEQRVEWLATNTDLDTQIAQLTNWGPAIPEHNIPEYNWLNDDVHSVRQHHATVFPDGCGLGPTFDRQLIREAAVAISKEARALFNSRSLAGQRGFGDNGWGVTAYGPNMNLVRNPRWGRAQEVYGEDPYLTSQLTIQLVQGYQTSSPDMGVSGTNYTSLLACCKHLAAYDAEDIPVVRYKFDAIVDTRDMWETFMPAFKACIQEGKAGSSMCSYNAINGVPTCADPNLMNGILRKDWNFDGFIVSDYDAWANIKNTHKYCPNMTCAAAVGINAGMDQEGGGTSAIKHLAEAITEGLTDAKHVATAFKRLFKTKLKLGMFDPPTLVPSNQLKNGSWVEGPAHLELARKTAQKTASLYWNKNNTLPLSASSISKIAVIGPQSDSEGGLLGNYYTFPDKGVATILDGARAAFQNATCQFEQNIDYYQPGQTGIPVSSPQECCNICTSDPVCKYMTFWKGLCFLKATNAGKRASPGRISSKCDSADSKVLWAKGCANAPCDSTAGFPEAVAVAKEADTIILVMGLDQLLERETHDRKTINLPPNQIKLMEEVRKAAPTTPIVALFVHGGTFALQNIPTVTDAILDMWYPGQMGGLAAFDVLLGKVSPAGRTSVTWYSSDSELPPASQNLAMYPIPGISKGVTYRYYTGNPVVPFGYGLSYSYFGYTFQGSHDFSTCDTLWINFTVKNRGNVDSDEVPQLYLSYVSAPVPVPRMRLCDFTRIHIKAGETSSTIQFQVKPDYYSMVTGGGVYEPTQVVMPGKYQLWVGGGQPGHSDGVSHEVDISGPTTPLKKCSQ